MKTSISITIPSIDDVTFTLLANHEEMPVKGAFATGDKEQDKEIERRIIEQVENGNVWAWCCISLTAEWNDITHAEYLGACSYASREDFVSHSGYYEDMKNSAYSCLIDRIKSMDSLG